MTLQYTPSPAPHLMGRVPFQRRLKKWCPICRRRSTTDARPHRFIEREVRAGAIRHLGATAETRRTQRNQTTGNLCVFRASAVKSTAAEIRPGDKDSE